MLNHSNFPLFTPPTYLPIDPSALNLQHEQQKSSNLRGEEKGFENMIALKQKHGCTKCFSTQEKNLEWNHSFSFARVRLAYVCCC